MQELTYQAAFVLHSRPFKENQAIMEVLVADEGRMSLVAYKGSKKNSGRNALMQPFRPLRLQIRKDSGLRKLVAIEAAFDAPDAIHLKGKTLYCGFYLNELICRLCPADALFPELYSIYRECLVRLQNLTLEHDAFERQLQWQLRRFEFRLLELMGYGLNLTHEADSGTQIDPYGHYLLTLKGFVQCTKSNQTIAGHHLLDLSIRLQDDEAECREPVSTYGDSNAILSVAKWVLRHSLHRHLGDKPLKSRELFRTR